MNMKTLTQLLVAMIFFSVSWFPLLYVEVLDHEDDGPLYLTSMIVNICAMFGGLYLMFLLMRKVSLDSIA